MVEVWMSKGLLATYALLGVQFQTQLNQFDQLTLSSQQLSQYLLVHNCLHVLDLPVPVLIVDAAI